MNMLNNAVTEETTIVTFDEWAKEMSDKYKNLFVDDYSGARVSLEAAKFLEPLVAGYMTAPTAIYKGTAIAAKTVAGPNINEFKTECLQMIQDGKEIVLYMPIWHPDWWQFTDLDQTTFEHNILDTAKFVEGKWKIRFAVFEKA
jgi:hypothetical protein